MKISYRLALEDVAAYYQFYMDTSPDAAAKRNKNIRLVTLVYMVIIAILALVIHNYQLAVFCLAAYFFSIIWYVRFGRRVNVKSLKKVYSRHGNNETLGDYSLELQKDGIKVNSPTMESVVDFHNIENIVETGSYIFLIVGPMAAYIIPKNSITEGNLESFIAGLKKRVK